MEENNSFLWLVYIPLTYCSTLILNKIIGVPGVSFLPLSENMGNYKKEKKDAKSQEKLQKIGNSLKKSERKDKKWKIKVKKVSRREKE